MEDMLDDCENSYYLSDSEFHPAFHTIYSAAKDGHAISLIATLNNFDEDLRTSLVNQSFDEDDGQQFTPLGIAATQGKITVVKALLSCYKIDLERECVMKFDGNMVFGATALWCAAGAGHLNIVKVLIKHGANVNHKTKAQSTPLRAACFTGRLDIVRYLVLHGADVHLANAYNNTCVMISSYKGHECIVEFLLKSGADPNEQALCGATALHYAAECGHVEICKLLLDFGAVMQKNEYGLTPVITAAERVHEQVVEMFSNRFDLLTKEEKIDALELMGASFANDKDNYNITKAYQYLMLGMVLRYDDSDNIIKKQNAAPIPAYENWIESQTLQDLQAIRLNHNSIHMESLTIRERILGKTYPDLPQHIVFRGAIFADQRRFDRCESLWLYALQLRQANKISVERDLLRFAQLYSQMYHTNENLILINLLSVISCCITELENNKFKIAHPGSKDDVRTIADEYEQNVVTVLYLITITTKILKIPNRKFNPSDLGKLYHLISKLITMNTKLRDGQTLLHLSVNGVTPVDDFHTSDVCRFPCFETAKLLLHCGASILSVDCDRNTPLHTLTGSLHQAARVGDEALLVTVDNIINIFVQAGVHLDAVNKNGLTATHMAPINAIELMIKKHEMKATSLKCLSSRCIAQHRLNYLGVVPRHLETFIEMHSADKFK